MATTSSETNPLPREARRALLLYNAFFPFVLLFLLPGFFLRMIRRGKYRHKFGQRFGIYSANVRSRLAGRGRVWIHAVSVGEVFIAQKIARELRSGRGDFQAVLSTTTSTGFALARDSAPEWMEVIYNPVDFPPFIRRALELVRPSRIILVEAEVWPNLVSQARRRGIPVSLVNARLSPRSERRFRRFRAFTGPIFRLLDLVCVQEPEDAGKWNSLGVDAARIRLVGSIKFDPAAAVESREDEFRSLLARLGVGPETPVLLAGSTHPGEETLLGQAFVELRKTIPGLFLIVVPRHVERTPGIVESLRSLGLSPYLRTALSTGAPVPPGVDCLLVDTTGELRQWYRLGTVLFVGKSLTGIGGQNPVEAIAAGRPVLFGPHMENFSAVVRVLLERQAAIQVGDGAELLREAARLFAGADLRARMARNAEAVLAPHDGATARTAALLSPVAAVPSPSREP